MRRAILSAFLFCPWGNLIWLSVIAIGLLVISGWPGGKMAYVYGIAVDTLADTMRR
jgi:uncharacterized membrane protein